MALRIRKPPSHRVDAPIVYIDPSDDAWLKEQYDTELREMRERNEKRKKEKDSEDLEDQSEHPMVKYFMGRARYDLSAKSPAGEGVMRCPMDYLDEDKRPTRFTLRRLPSRRYHEVMELVDAGRDIEAKRMACRYGLKECSDSELELEGTVIQCLTEEDMEKLDFAAGDLPDGTVDRSLSLRIGDAVIRASHTLSEDEKKA